MISYDFAPLARHLFFKLRHLEFILSCFCFLPGPGSSDTSDATSPEDGGTPLRTGELVIDSDEEEDEEEEEEEGRSLTPNLRSPSISASNNKQHFQNSGNLANGVIPLAGVSNVNSMQPTSGCPNNPTPIIHSSVDTNDNKDDLALDPSFTNHQPGYFSKNSPIPYKDGRRWAVRRQESDLSTAPFSSETSDMDTSGNERVMTTDSMVDVNSDVHCAQSPPLNRARCEAKGIGVVSEKGLSGSSGDEILSRRRTMKKPIMSSKVVPSKPPPPYASVKKAPLAQQGNNSLSVNGGSLAQLGPSHSPTIQPRRPISHTKSSPLLPNRFPKPPPASVKKSQFPTASTSTTHIPAVAARHTGTKPVLSSRPKPPVNPKPTGLKPAVAPKKPHFRIGPSVGGESSGMMEPGKPPPKPTANLTPGGRSHSIANIEYSTRAVGAGGMHKSYSVESDITRQTTAPKPARVLPKTPVKGIQEETAALPVREKRPDGTIQGSPSPPPVPSHRPSVPVKPRRLSEKRYHVNKPQPTNISNSMSSVTDGCINLKSGEAVVTTSTGTSNVLISINTVSSIQTGSSKNLSSSEVTTSEQSQSPIASPSPSPSVLKRSFQPGKATVAPPSVVSRRPPPPNTASRTSVSSVGERERGGEEQGEERRREVRESGAEEGRGENVGWRVSNDKRSGGVRQGRSRSRGKSEGEVVVPPEVREELRVVPQEVREELCVKKEVANLLEANCTTGTDPVAISVSEVSLTESPSPSPSPLPSASDLSADQNKRHQQGPPGARSDSSSSLETTPPPIPPRGYLMSPESLASLNLQLSVEPTASPPPPKRKLKQGPRRPPPCPPTNMPITDATPTSNTSTSTGGRQEGESLPDQPAATTVDVRAIRGRGDRAMACRSLADHPVARIDLRARADRVTASHYEVVDDFQVFDSGVGKYFEKHSKRDMVDTVNYALVKKPPSVSSQDSGEGDSQEVGGASEGPHSPLPPYRPGLQRSTTVVDSSSGFSVRMERDKESTTKGVRVGGYFHNRKQPSIGRRPPPRPPKAYNSSSSTSSVPATGMDPGGIYSIVGETDKGDITSGQGGMKPKLQRKFIIGEEEVEDGPPPLPSRPAPKIKSPVSPEPGLRGQKQLASPPLYRGLVLAKDGPPLLPSQPKGPKSRDPIYDVIPETMRNVRGIQKVRRDYEEIILPDLERDEPRLWVPPKQEKEQLQEQDEQPKHQEQQRQQQQQMDEWSGSSGKSSPFLSKRDSSSSCGSGSGVPLISVILPGNKENMGSRMAANKGKKNLDIEDLRENWREEITTPAFAPPSNRITLKRHAMSFSGRRDLMAKSRNTEYRRSHSDHLNKLKISTLNPSASEIVSE